MPCVYFIRKGDSDVYKIGKSSHDGTSRLASLQTGNEEVLTLCATIQTNSSHSASEVERYLHNSFKACRLQGEWFALGASDIEAALQYFRGKGLSTATEGAFNSCRARFVVKTNGTVEDRKIEALQKALVRVKELERENERIKSHYRLQADRKARESISRELAEHAALRAEWYEQKQELDELRARLKYHQIVKQEVKPSWWQRFTQWFNRLAEA